MTLQAWLEENPFTLSLSSGFFGFFAHAGFVKALEENGLSPRKLTGASAGAIIAGAVAAGMTAREIEDLVLRVKLKDFWDPSPGLGFVRGKRFEKLLGETIGRDFSTNRKPLDIAAFNIFKRKTEIFSSGDMARSIRASSAVPLLFHPVMISKQLYWDGGILDKLALDNTSPDETVLGHYLFGNSGHERYERRRDDRLWNDPAFGKSRKLVVLKNLARSGPRKIHLGPEILESAYRQTLEVLKAPMESNLKPW